MIIQKSIKSASAPPQVFLKWFAHPAPTNYLTGINLLKTQVL